MSALGRVIAGIGARSWGEMELHAFVRRLESMGFIESNGIQPPLAGGELRHPAPALRGSRHHPFEEQAPDAFAAMARRDAHPFHLRPLPSPMRQRRNICCLQRSDHSPILFARDEMISLVPLDPLEGFEIRIVRTLPGPPEFVVGEEGGDLTEIPHPGLAYLQ